MLEKLLEGTVLGLATGTACLATCGPVYFSYLLSEKRSGAESVRVILLLSAGRFVSYALFGAGLGLIGGYLTRSARLVLSSSGYILFSLFLVLSVVRISKSCSGCESSGLLRLTRNPLLLGLLTGFSLCPAFLIALTRAFDASGAIAGAVLFVGFFFGTTAYMVPFAFFGLLTGRAWIRTAASGLALLVAVFFMATGVRSLVRMSTGDESSLVVPVGDPHEPGVFSATEADTIYVVTLSGYPGDRGAELARDLAMVSSALPPLRVLELDSTALTDGLQPLPELAAVIAPSWVDRRAAEDLERWRLELAQILESRRARVFAVEYEPYCEDRARSVAAFLERFSFRCDPDSGFSFLMLNDLDCLPEDCATCPFFL
ncbi:sulfite exporter TauE/SafE family protein [Candidatus Fermentibacterales bacterium]|nr:sulfite exporter TauE/SafE family protein [Candidatus Fermentibacterales bacterium]